MEDRRIELWRRRKSDRDKTEPGRTIGATHTLGLSSRVVPVVPVSPVRGWGIELAEEELARVEELNHDLAGWMGGWFQDGAPLARIRNLWEI